MAEQFLFNLSEDLEQELLEKYRGLSEDLTQILNLAGRELDKICNDTQYEPMKNVVNKTIELFDNKIKEISNRAFEAWIEGEGSFTAASENSQSGEAALGTAKQIETEIRGIYEDFWASHPLGEEIQLDTSRPKVKSENFDDLKEIYTKVFQEVESKNEDILNQIKESGEDNPTWNVIIPAVKALTEPIKAAFEQFCTRVDEAKAESESQKQRQDTKNDEAAQVAADTSANAADLAQALTMFDDI